MLTRYVVSYDVREAKRLRRVFKRMRNYGDHLQYSVFDCLLSAKDLIRMKSDLAKEVDAAEDQVLIIKLGPADSRAADAIDSLGVKHEPPDRVVLVI